MYFTPDSYSAMILYEFPAFFTCTSDRSGIHIKTCLSCHHSLYGYSATRIRPLFKASSFVFIVQIGKKSMVSHLFSRVDIYNISPLRAAGEKK